MKIKPSTPVQLPLKHLDWERITPYLKEANEALERFNYFLLKASPSKLELLKWEESRASLRGQNIKATLKEVLQFSKDFSAEEKRAGLLKKILNAQKGLTFAIHWAKTNPLNTRFFCRLHGIVKQDGPNPKDIGKIRKRQNWIGHQGCPIEEAYFYPPLASKVDRYLKELYRYNGMKDKDPLVQVAIFFAQFLIIHPFMDGNGRVARIYIPVALWKKKAIPKPYLFLSDYFETHRLHYFQKLFDITAKNAWEEWIIYFLKGIRESAKALP